VAALWRIGYTTGSYVLSVDIDDFIGVPVAAFVLLPVLNGAALSVSRQTYR
jgi:hypothetical protein